MTFDAMDHVMPYQSTDEVIRLAKSVSKNPILVEVGAWAGMSTIKFADAGCRVFVVDHWQGNVEDHVGDGVDPEVAFQTFCRNVGPRLFRSVFPCRGSSLQWASVWPFPVDIVFLDDDHRYPAVRSGITAWRQHVRQGGFLCGHDYDPNDQQFPGVVRAVDEVFPMVNHAQLVWWRRM